MSKTKNETKNPASTVQPGNLNSEILNPACIGSIGGVGNADAITAPTYLTSEILKPEIKGQSLPLADRFGDGTKPVTESHADELDCTRCMRISISKVAQCVGDIMQSLRNGLGGFLVALGKLVQGSSDGVCGGHKVGDIITYRPFGQFQPRQGRIERIVDEYVYVDNGDRVDAFHIFEGGLA